MKRRSLIRSIATVGTIAVAGCTSNGGDNGQNEQQQATAEITNTQIISAASVTAGQDGEIPWAITDVENTSKVDHGPIQLEQRFYEQDDTLIEVRDGYLDLLPSDTTWRYYQRFYMDDPDRLDHVDVRIAESDPVVSASVIEEATVVNSEMTAEPESGVELVGEIDIGDSSPDRIVIIGLVYDDAGRLRGSVRDVADDPSQTVAFSASDALIRTPPDSDQQATSHKTMILNGLP